MKSFIYTISLFLMISCTNTSSDGFKKHSTVNQYLKPGAAVDIEHGNTKIDTNKILDLKFYLITEVKSGYMNVKLKLTDKLEILNEDNKNINIEIKENKIKYPISLQVFSEKSGIHYINLLISLKGKLRSFSIPIYVGDYEKIINANQKPNNSKYVIQKAVGTIVE